MRECVLNACFSILECFGVLLVIEVGAGPVGVEDMVVGVEIDGLGEELDGFGVLLCLEGNIPLVFKLSGLLVAH